MARPHAPSAPSILAAVLIARDEARCIARCLDSVRPWVDRIVLLDTGSTDDTAAIAARHGATVYHLPWPEDFAAARNQALALADADWNLVIDADEWIETGGEGLRDCCAGPPRLGRLCIHSRSDAADGAATATRSWLTRLLPRGVRYRGRIHEQPVSPLPRERIDLHLGHDGYLAEQLAAKRGRNRALLERELADRPDDPYILYQLGAEAEGRDDAGAASGFYARAFALAPRDEPWLHELLLRHLHCLARAGRLDEALALAGREMDSWAESPDFFFVLGNLLLDQAIADPADAMSQWLPLAAQAWERCLAIGERPDLEGSVFGRGSHLARHNLDLVRSQLG